MTKVYHSRDNFSTISVLFPCFCLEYASEIHKKEYEPDRECDMAYPSKSGYHMILCFREWSHPNLGESSYDHHRDRKYQSDSVYPEKRFPVLLFRESESVIEEENEEVPHHPESKYMTMDYTEHSISGEVSCEFTIGKSDEESCYHREQRESCQDGHRREVRK